MFNFQGIVNTKFENFHIKTLKAPRIKFSQKALDILGLNQETHELFLDKDLTSGNFYAAAVAPKTVGKKINTKGIIGHGALHNSLGGEDLEFRLSENEPLENDGVKYFKLELVSTEDAPAATIAEDTQADTQDTERVEAQVAPQVAPQAGAWTPEAEADRLAEQRSN